MNKERREELRALNANLTRVKGQLEGYIEQLQILGREERYNVPQFALMHAHSQQLPIAIVAVDKALSEVRVAINWYL